MSRYNLQQTIEPPKGRPVSALDAARANDFFESFLNANTLKTILGTYRSICDLLHLKPNALLLFYPRLREYLTSWRAKALWKKFDARANNKCYGKGKLCPNTRVLIIGAGPCGLRTAIEAQLLGAKVVVVEKRDRISRNNVLHLWPFVIDDLRLLGAKKFFGKFCAGAIDHISIRQLQCILLKVALLLGVEIHTEVSFERLIEPNPEEKTGWKAEFKPIDHPVNQFEFDVVIGADGKRNTLQGFKRKEFRGKLAIAITANFINKRTEAEARVEEISGVAFIFNQKFFKDLFAETGIDLENIVYYKDDTHYFVMTAKKQSLIDKSVIKQDLQDTAKLLAHENVDRNALMNYAREAAEFSTNYMMLDLEFAVNHYGQPDVAMFDFTSMYQAENASRIIERHGYRLLSILVGDSLLEPFWPTGSGCARGFLSSLDAGWAIRSYGSNSSTPLEVLAERESIYRLLPQTTPENLNRDYKSYTLDPSTRYPNLNRNLLLPPQVISLFDTDDVKSIELSRTPLMFSVVDNPNKRRRRDSHVDPDTLLCWIRDQVKEHEDLEVANITTSFKDGRVLCAIISHYRPDLLDYSTVTIEDAVGNNQVAFDLLEKDLGIPAVMTVEKMVNSDVPDFRTMVAYLTQIYDAFRGEIPHIKHAKLRALSATRKCLVNSNAPAPSLTSLPNSTDLLNCVDVPKNQIVELFKSKWMTGTADIISSSSRSERSNSKTLAKLNESTNTFVPLISELEADIVESRYNITKHAHYFNDEVSNSRYATQSVLIDKCTSQDDAIENVINEPEQQKAINTYIDVLTTDASTDAIAMCPSATKCIQTDENFTKTEKVDKYCSCNTLEIHQRSKPCPGNLNIVVKNNETVHSVKYDYTTRCLYIMLPDFIQKLRSNLISSRQLDVFKHNHVYERHDFLSADKFLSLKMNHVDHDKNGPPSEYNVERVMNWISASNFNQALTGTETPKSISVPNLDGLTDITSVTRQKPINLKDHACTNAREEGEDKQTSEAVDTLENLTKILEEVKKQEVKSRKHADGFKILSEFLSKHESKETCSVIVEAEENEWPESRRHQDAAFTKNHPAIKPAIALHAANSAVTTPTAMGHHRTSTRHKRHAELPEAASNTAASHDRKPRKRRSAVEKFEKISVGGVEERMKRLEEIASNRNERQSKRRQQRKMQTEQFIKSMQMLAANSISENSEPFEDYSIFLYRQTAPNFEDRVKDLEKKFTYIPERENRLPAQLRGEKDEDFLARIKGMEEKVYEGAITEKRPKDLLRAIGKIDNSDWNIREIEKKIIENKLGKNVNKDKEKVPKWSKEQFQARQMKMEKQHLERQDSAGDKYAEIDKNIKLLDQRVREGSVRDLNQKKVAQITEKLKPKTEEVKPVQKSSSKPAVVLPNQGISETCHFCNKRVYLMERLSAEGKFFHRGCFRCQYCHTALRLGSYMFDRDGKYGYRFYCAQHFGLSGEIKQTKVIRKPSQKIPEKSPEKKFITGVDGVDLLKGDDRVAGQTPERIEFDLSAGHASSDHEEPLSQMDEDEWTDRNFGASTAEVGSSDDEDSSFSETDDDDDDAFEEALEEPPTKEGTLKLLNTLCKKRFTQRHQNESDSDSYSSSDRSSYYENSSGDDDSDTATEGEEEIRARERRKMEVQVKPPIVHTDTGTDTEIASDDETSSSSEVQNSATEISTDSEFAQDDPTPTCEIPSIVFNDMYVTKTRGSNKISLPQKVQVKSAQIQKPILNTASTTTSKPGKDIELKFTPLVQTPIRKPVAPLLLRTEGYALNRTQSTGGIATKVSLELKKKYLLGENNTSTAIQKSGSASTLDSKFKSFHSNISDCQKLLKPSAEISASMQTFCNKLDEQRTSPISPLAVSRPIFKLPENVIVTSSVTVPSTTNLIVAMNATKNEIIEEQPEVPVVPNESEGRPRSPVHETSIIVPQIDWSQQLKEKQLSNEGSSDTTTSSTDSDDNQIQKSPSVKAFHIVSDTTSKGGVQDNPNDNIPMDSLNYISYSKIESQPSSIQDPPKSISSEKKVLNQPKKLPNLDDDLLLAQVHSVLHKPKPVIIEPISKPEEHSERIISGRSTPSHESGVCQVTAALTETELSDWAHDGMVSDDFAESDYEVKEQEKAKDKPLIVKKATIVEAENLNVKRPLTQNEPAEKIECISNILCPMLDNIEFMDTGSESSEEDEIILAKNNGYVQFHDEDDIAEDSLSPVINNVIVEAKSPMIKATLDEDFDVLSTVDKNTGYCFIADGNQDTYGGEVIDLKPRDLQILKEKQSMYDNEEDSLIIIEKSTTDENTCSDSTVKNVTEIAPRENRPVPPPTAPILLENNNTLDKKRLEDKLAQVKSEMKMISEQRKAAHIEEQNMRNNIEFVQHCQRLQSKVDFGNAKDSIDIRKARRQSKSGSPPKPDLIQEEKEITSPIRSRKEQIEMERDLNKKLVQEMVMNKMRKENKSLERKRRNRNFSPNLSPSRPFELNKSPTVDIGSQIRHPTPDVLLSTINTPLQKSETMSEFHSDMVTARTKYNNNSRPLSAFVAGKSDHLTLTEKALPNSDAFSLPDIQKAIDGDFTTPKAPPRTKNEVNYTVEKLKQDARARARLLSDEDLGLSPEEKLAQLRMRLARRGKENDDIHLQGNIQPLGLNPERPSTLFYKNDTLNKKKIASFRRSKSGDDHLNLKVNSQPTRERTKSFGETQVKLSIRSAEGNDGKCFKSDPNLLLDSVEVNKKKEKKSKDRERRKSITKLFTDFFAKKKDFNVTSTHNSSGNRGFLSRISPKTKDKSKDIVKEEPVRRMSYTETRKFAPGNVSPPPIPPLPLNYTGAKSIDDSSDGEGEWRRHDRSSCDTLDQSGIQDGSISSRRSSSRSARKVRQSQSKRHRMAQEIQRKLEETDVKTRELELRGVTIEKALRGECESSNQDETVLLKEWFDLMRDITELRRYERELMVRAQELELEDRHARLQHDLKDRLSNEHTKSEKDVESERCIIKEMLDIVAKRDSLIVLLEEERLRYKEEDRTLEEQMLAKGINVATVVNSAAATTK